MYSEMNNNEIALPLQYQQIIQAVNIEPYLNYVENIFKTPLGYATVLFIFLTTFSFFYLPLVGFMVCHFILVVNKKVIPITIVNNSQKVEKYSIFLKNIL